MAVTNVEMNAGGEGVLPKPEGVEERYALLDGGRIALVQDKTSAEIVGVQLLFGGVISNRMGAMHTLDLLEGVMRMTGWRIDQVARMPSHEEQAGVQ